MACYIQFYLSHIDPLCLKSLVICAKSQVIQIVVSFTLQMFTNYSTESIIMSLAWIYIHSHNSLVKFIFNTERQEVFFCPSLLLRCVFCQDITWWRTSQWWTQTTLITLWCSNTRFLTESTHRWRFTVRDTCIFFTLHEHMWAAESSLSVCVSVRRSLSNGQTWCR